MGNLLNPRTITLGGVSYPIEFNLNVIEQIEEETDQTIVGALNEMIDVEKMVKATKKIVTILVNESRIEKGETPLTEREVGKMINTKNKTEIQLAIFDEFNSALPEEEEEGPNEKSA